MKGIFPMNKKQIIRPLQIKSLDDASGSFEGYGAIFGNIDSYGDIIVRGAFQNCLKSMKPNECKLLWQHDTTMPIGVYESIEEDENGLHVKGRLLINDIEKARECYALLKAGAINGLSIGYSVNQNGATFNDGNMYLKDLKLWKFQS
jgi:HK97 family phage prohead protease